MISKKTVFVLGAGASMPYGFPLGNELKRWIYQALASRNSPGRKIMQALFQTSDDEIDGFLKDLSSATSLTLDEFLQYRPEHSQAGKAAIALALVPCENPVSLFSDGKGQWYSYLFRRMGTSHLGFNRDTFEESTHNLSVITFNYDRSLEYFLYPSLVTPFGEQFAKTLLGQLHFVHVYGRLGKLKFLDPAGRDYQNSVSLDDIKKCVTDIVVMPERSENSAEFQQAHEYIREAETLCFIGFGYDPNNLRRLQLDTMFKGSQILGCAKDVAADEQRQIRILFGDETNPSRPQFSRILRLGNGNQDAIAFLKNYPVFDT